MLNSSKKKADLKAFLLTLTDTTIASNPLFQSPLQRDLLLHSLGVNSNVLTGVSSAFLVKNLYENPVVK